MKPNEFWKCTYREVYQFVKANQKHEEKEYKKEIVLFDSLGEKLLSALASRRPKKVSLVKNVFKDLFAEELSPKNQTIEEQIRILRGMK